MTHRFDEKPLREAVIQSKSFRQVLQVLGIVAAGGNYDTLKRYIKKYQIDTSHFTGQLWSKGIIIGPKQPIEEYLSNQRYITSYKLKNRLFEEKILARQCMECRLTSWRDRPIALELHHKDGNKDNNNLSNLSILCPNCHAQTTNYRGKNISKK
jgi:hypothetical protein